MRSSLEKQIIYQTPPSRFDDPDEVGRALKKLGMTTVKLAVRFAGNVLNTIDKNFSKSF
jgi:hypothetical protein